MPRISVTASSMLARARYGAIHPAATAPVFSLACPRVMTRRIVPSHRRCSGASDEALRRQDQVDRGLACADPGSKLLDAELRDGRGIDQRRVPQEVVWTDLSSSPVNQLSSPPSRCMTPGRRPRSAA